MHLPLTAEVKQEAQRLKELAAQPNALHHKAMKGHPQWPRLVTLCQADVTCGSTFMRPVSDAFQKLCKFKLLSADTCSVEVLRHAEPDAASLLALLKKTQDEASICFPITNLEP